MVLILLNISSCGDKGIKTKEALKLYASCSNASKDYIKNNCVCTKNSEISKEYISSIILRSPNKRVRLLKPNSPSKVATNASLVNGEGIMMSLKVVNNSWCIERVIKK